MTFIMRYDEGFYDVLYVAKNGNSWDFEYCEKEYFLENPIDCNENSDMIDKVFSLMKEAVMLLKLNNNNREVE